VESVTCQPILDEFVEKLVDKFGFTPERAQQAAQEVRDLSTLVTVSGQLKVVKADPDDDIIVECALTASAEYIVTGDRHLIDLEQYASVQMVRPARFVELVALEG
jgi:putative PIN family toxin of toxin-antitoxin system